MNDDLDTIRRVLAADVESFRRLVERYQRPLLTLIRNLTPPDTDHEGVAQEVFLAAFRSLASFDPKRSAFSTWLFTIARNRCRNELARRRPVVGAELPDNTTYQRRFMRRGDEVVFRVSSEPGMNWAKRVIALPGDTVEVKDKEVFVNGRQLPREPAPRASLGAAAQVVKGELFEETNAGRRYRILFTTDTKPLLDYPKAKVPDGMCFVLGDNRNNSRDSRTIGFVALGDVLGDVQYRYWPAATWTRFGVLTE